VPNPYPSEFRDDVVRVASNREPGVTIEQIARDFGVHPMTLQKWMRRADIDEGAKPGSWHSVRPCGGRAAVATHGT
jgi:transposase